MLKRLLIIILLFYIDTVFAVIILLNGTGSAGKTSIACVLDNLVPGVFERISLDKIIWQKLISTAVNFGYLDANLGLEQSKQSIERLPRSRVNFLWTHSKIDPSAVFKQAREQALVGKSVIIDTVMKNHDEIKACLSLLSGLNVCMVLVYCPLDLLAKRVALRNQLIVNGEKRLLRWAVDEFFLMYQIDFNQSQEPIDTMKHSQIESTVLEVKKEFLSLTQNESDVQSGLMANHMQSWVNEKFSFIENKFALNSNYLRFLFPCLTYDFVINTGLKSTYDGAYGIRDLLSNQTNFGAFAKNQKIFQNLDLIK